jgi:hypothetical protein
MKHAGPASLEVLGSLLEEVRQLPSLVEKKTGIFYSKGTAFLHFHEDREGLFADARVNGRDFSRFPVNSSAERAKRLRALRDAVSQEMHAK